jgi:predicted RNA-binding Zn-ribbon protein involved in translation (DUF1610 family)
MIYNRIQSVKFYCPNCGAFIAFAKKYAGKTAKCISCGQRFVIPKKDDQIPQKVKLPTEKFEPLPNFYHAAYIENFKAFFSRQNIVPFTAVTAAVIFNFFFCHLNYTIITPNINFFIPIGLAASFFCWGFLFYYYFEVIGFAVDGFDNLPDVDIDSIPEFLSEAAKSVFFFAYSLVASMLPCIASLIILGVFNISSRFIPLTISYLCIIIFPQMLLYVSLTRDVTAAFQYNVFFNITKKGFLPIFTITILFVIVWAVQLTLKSYGSLTAESNITILLYLAANIALQFFIIFSMRALGLFGRHYESLLNLSKPKV